MGLSGLSSLGSIAGALPNLGGSSTTQKSGTGSAPASSGPSWLTGELAQIVTILLGLVLIVAGLFSFEKVQAVTGAAAKAAVAA